MKRSEREERTLEVTSISELVAKVLRGYHVALDVRRHRIATEWLRIVGPRIAAHASPGYLRDGQLDVLVTTSSWLHELSFLSDRIVARIHEVLGDPQLVSEIRWKLVKQREVRAQPSSGRRAPRGPGERVEPRPAPPRRSQAIREDTARIEDPELRDIITRVREDYDL